MIHAPIIISGPTGSGKSELAHRIAKHFSGEVINADSVQLYSGHDIGAAIPSQSHQEQVRYHLYGALSGSKPCDVQGYVHAAQAVLEDVQNRGVTPVIVGGSTLYLEGLLAGISQLPPSKPELRRELESEKTETLYERLSSLDPQRSASLHPHDRIRIVRSLEVCLLSGQTYTELCAKDSRVQICHNATVVIPVWSRSDLYRRIEKRAERMVREGIIEEARYLFGCFGSEWQCRTALGYKQIFERLVSREAVEQHAHKEIAYEIAQATRRYAKRQMTYWRNAPRKFHWDVFPDNKVKNKSEIELLAQDSGKRGATGEHRRGFHVWKWGLDKLCDGLRERRITLERRPDTALCNSSRTATHEVWFLHAEKLGL
ncbi:MAG: tRNA (adenosine(37)-N6)-dimethylallyltransferase MiaA [Bdellovibrionota bacterium]|jgi:tRNA dimethylallyltransferase